MAAYRDDLVVAAECLFVDLELTIVREAKRHDADAFHRLRSVPGIGKVLTLTVLYEIHDMTRFDRVQEFASYARLVNCQKPSAGKITSESSPSLTIAQTRILDDPSPVAVRFDSIRQPNGCVSAAAAHDCISRRRLQTRVGLPDL